MASIVTRADYPNKEMPSATKSLLLVREYSTPEFEQLAAGHLWQDMDNKWCSFFESPWVHLHRSWSGVCIYNVRLTATPGGCEVAEAIVNCDLAQVPRFPNWQQPEVLAVILDGLAGRDLGIAWKRYHEGTILEVHPQDNG